MRNGMLLGAVLAGMAPWTGAAAQQFAHLRGMAGEYTDAILADPALDAELRAGLGGEFDSFMAAMQVVFPSELYDNRFLILTGCMPHDCDAHRGLVIVDLDGGGVQVIRSDLYGGFIPLSPAAEAAVDAWNH